MHPMLSCKSVANNLTLLTRKTKHLAAMEALKTAVPTGAVKSAALASERTNNTQLREIYVNHGYKVLICCLRLKEQCKTHLDKARSMTESKTARQNLLTELTRRRMKIKIASAIIKIRVSNNAERRQKRKKMAPWPKTTCVTWLRSWPPERSMKHSSGSNSISRSRPYRMLMIQKTLNNRPK